MNERKDDKQLKSMGGAYPLLMKWQKTKMRILFLILPVMLFACIHKRVHKNFRQYAPYKLNDVLVFRNATTLKTDTFFVTAAKDFPESDGPVPHVINRHTFVCGAYTSGFKDYVSLNPRAWTRLIEIIPDYLPGPARPYTNGIFFEINNNSFKLHYFLPFDTLKQKNMQAWTMEGKSYTDVYEIDVPYSNNLIDQGNIRKFFWSRSAGYLQLITDKKELIVLIQKSNDMKAVDLVKKSEKDKNDHWQK